MSLADRIAEDTIYSLCGQTFFKFELDRLFDHQKICRNCIQKGRRE